jgi:xylulokinase
MGVAMDDMMACGGGARSPLWRQMLADLYGCPVKTSRASDEGPALGAAILAGVGSGIYSSVEEACSGIVLPDDSCLPDAGNAAEYEKFYKLYLRAYPALKDIYAGLADPEGV